VIALLFLFLQFSPPTNVQAFDTPNDAGSSITVTWELSSDDRDISHYEILRSDGEEYDSVGITFRGTTTFKDEGAENGVAYSYRIRAVFGEEHMDSDVSGSATCSAQWFHSGRWNALILGFAFCGLALWYIREAKKGKPLFIRKISGLEAVDDAVGRATEMGRPILFSTGLGSMSEIATIAALSILGRVAKRTAYHNTPLIVPNRDPVVMTAAQEIVKQAHMEVGRPDTYDESKIFYLTQDQFGYAAGVDGIMVREKPGAVFLQGWFYAESLLLAETGASIGAIQIAGTPATGQLPFFIASCDYTLIGEEMYAASSYLSREPTLLGSIKGEDYSKAIIITLIGIGILLATLSNFGILGNWSNSFADWSFGCHTHWVNVLECPADGGARKINDFALHTRNYRWIGVVEWFSLCLCAEMRIQSWEFVVHHSS
jgi:hypothetical protein